MTISIHIEAGLAVATCVGTLGVQEARNGARLLWDTSDWDGRAVLWDFRRAEFDLAAPDVRDVAAFVLESQRSVPPLRVAFVTPTDLTFGLARMFEAFREDRKTEFRVFRDYDEAVEWTRIATSH